MRPVLLAIATTALLSACGSGGGGSAPAPQQPAAPDVLGSLTPGNSVTDITDRSICEGPTPETTWLFSSAWGAKHEVDNGVVLERIMSFTQSDLEVTVEAKYKDQSKLITVNSPITWADNQFEILSQNQDEAILPLDEEDFKLSFGLSPSSVKYSFVGPCLQIESGEGEKLVLVPMEDSAE